MLAKIASDSAKPDGMLVIEPGTELAFLHPLPVRRLWGVGPATQRKLTDLGVSTVGRPGRRSPERVLVDKLGAGVGPPPPRARREPRPAARGAGPRGEVDRPRGDVRDRPRTTAGGSSRTSCAWPTASRARLREHAKVARTVQLKLRYRDFATITRARTLPEADRSRGHDRRRRRATLLDAVDLRDGIRLLGVTALQLEDAVAVQAQLPFGAGAVGAARDDALERTIDAVRARFGADAVGRAAHAADGRVRTDRRGSLWGPDDEPADRRAGAVVGRRGVTCCASR